MTYRNSAHMGRIIVIPSVPEAFANLFTSLIPSNAMQVPLALSNSDTRLYLEPDGISDANRHVYNFPYILHADGTPWIEANSYFLDLVEAEHFRKRPTDRARRKAAHLLDYKIFCEDSELDWLDFTGRRRSHRPTYRYARYLADSNNICSESFNQRTGNIYDFYSYVASTWHEIDLERVDKCQEVQILVDTSRGSTLVKRTKRSQTLPRTPVPEVEMGFVREDGEDLRPLSNKELHELLQIIHGHQWSQMERLIIKTAVVSGARKQTILTLRVRHLQNMVSHGVGKEGAYVLHVGPRTGVDTKYNKKQTLHFPPQLIEQLSIFVESPFFTRRRNKFILGYKKAFPLLPVPSLDDAYIFLSDQGGCYYMAKGDERYPFVRSPAVGQVTDNIKRKLLKTASINFPTDFSFHWLRATFGYLLFQRLAPLVQNGTITLDEQIGIIQRKMHHASRATTESYLKLYSRIFDKILHQEIFEAKIFEWTDFTPKMEEN